MKPPCDVVASDILPAARAYVANRLIEKGLFQVKVAELMGLTQPAVSQYRRQMRGYRKDMFEKDPQLLKMMVDLADSIRDGLPVKEQSIIFRDICRHILSKGLACELHRKGDASLADCDICLKSGFCSG